MPFRSAVPHRGLLPLPALAAAVWPLAALAATPVRPPVVTYTIEVSLDSATHKLDGKERLVWRNPSSDAVDELRFHTYLNAFKNNRSTFLRESGGRLRGAAVSTKAEDWGWIDVVSLRSADGTDLRPGAAYIRPDDNDASDETVLSVPLPSPVPPHGEITLEIAFRAKLPRIFARTGFVRDYHLVGQWFPKIGVYEAAGMRGRAAGGWNCHAFHANSEFYADFGDYDVTIDVPGSFLVGATGRRVSETKRGSRTRYRYVEENVHDFAWTADPHFAVHEVHFDPATDIPPGWAARAAEELGVPEAELERVLKPVSVRLLLQPDHARARDRYVLSARQGLAFYGLWYGVYPYETLTIVDPPDDGEGSGGMEYPTFITGGTFGIPLRWPFDRIRVVEDVTIHEFGHQYWYGLVGTNEFEEAWLDEGVNTDSEYRAMNLAYGPRELEIPGGIGADELSLAHADYAALPNLDPIRRFAWKFASTRHYGVNSYPKVGLFLAQLKHDLGARDFARAEREYFLEWSYRHPSTDDFFAVFERVTGRDLSTYRAHLVEGTARLDWSVVSARTEEREADQGVFDGAKGRETHKQDGAKTSLYDTSVLFGNLGEWPHASKARLVFEDGMVVDRVLPAEARWARLTTSYRSKLAWAAADPDRENSWERNRENDSKVLGTGKGLAATRGQAAAVKTFGWLSYLVGFLTQILWALA